MMGAIKTFLCRKGFKSGPFIFFYRFFLNPDGSVVFEQDGYRSEYHILDGEIKKSIKTYGKWACYDASLYTETLAQKLLQGKLPLGTT